MGAALGLIAALLAGCATSPSVRTPASDDSELSAALARRDMRALVAHWSAGTGARDPASLRGCVLRRFGAAPPTVVDDWPDGAGTSYAGGAVDVPAAALTVSAAFAAAWREQLLQLAAPDEAEETLARALAAVSLEQGVGLRERVDADALSDALDRTLAASGLHAFVVRRDGLIDLVLWQREEVRAYDVQLPDGRIEVRVRLVDAPLVRGWRAWASCEAQADDAWSDSTQVVLMRTREDPDGEVFRAHRLAREGQRLWDERHAPMLDAAERQYRMALAELAHAETDGFVHARLATLQSLAARGREQPAAHAAWALGVAMASRLAGSPAMPDAAAPWQGLQVPALRAADVRRVATELLRASSASLAAPQDGERVRFLPD